MAGGNKSNEEKLIGDILEKDKVVEAGILQILKETRQVGKAALQELRDQGKQLNGAQYDIDEILFQQDQSKQKIRTIKSIFWDLFYRIAPCLKKRSDFNNHVAKPPRDGSSTSKIHDVLGGDIIADSLQDPENRDKYKETDKILDEMGNIIGDLKEIADDMGNEIKHHNNQLDELHDTTGKAQDNNDIQAGTIEMMLR